MSTIFETLTPRVWRSILIMYLDNWSMLELIQTNKLLNKHKKFVYMLIFQTITTTNYSSITFALKEPSYELLYDYTSKYKYLVYKHVCFDKTKLVYLVKNLKILLTNNTILRKMVISHIKRDRKGNTIYERLNELLPIK
tara:strand:+ start:352 stop:768 length:417 start_codon:yes stop_codon:yes gene_type:complete